VDLFCHLPFLIQTAASLILQPDGWSGSTGYISGPQQGSSATSRAPRNTLGNGLGVRKSALPVPSMGDIFVAFSDHAE
jgi:hypothetical protein